MFLENIHILANVIQKEPGIIVGPITKFLGVILNFLFDMATFLTEKHSLGISIIFLTIITRTLMLPISFKQQKSMVAMQMLQPELEKIKAKYGNSNDPELKQKMNLEIQQVYSKNKVNPLSGCLPLFITFPIFIALSYLMNQSYMFIGQLGNIYEQLALSIQEIPGYIGFLKPIIETSNMVPNGMAIDIAVPLDLMKCINKFNQPMWDAVIQGATPEIGARISEILIHKQNMEHFMGINLIEVSGLMFPGVLIPILSGATTFMSSWIISRKNKSTDKNAQMQQKIMLTVMPVMMGVMTINFPAGVGVYWIVSGFYQVIQQPLIDKYYTAKLKSVKIIENIDKKKSGGAGK